MCKIHRIHCSINTLKISINIKKLNLLLFFKNKGNVAVCISFLLRINSKTRLLKQFNPLHTFVSGTVSNNSFRSTVRLLIGLDPYQDVRLVGPDLGQNGLQKLSADDKSRR